MLFKENYMKFKKIIFVMVIAIVVISVGMIYFFNEFLYADDTNNMIKNIVADYQNKYFTIVNDFVADANIKMQIVYDGMTMDELAAKLDRYLASDLSGKGYLYASHCIEMGVDPYLAVAISMHETGCKWGCSKLVKQCNNVGGQKGFPGCNGGSYKEYATLDEGIVGFIDNIYNNYVAFGLLTANEMNPKYAEDPNWSTRVNNYIEQIRQV